MPARVTAAEVIKVLDPDGLEGLKESFDAGEFELTTGIDTADGLVTQVCLESGYSDTWLKTITLWLAAHFCSVSTPKTKQEAAKGLTETYEGQTQLGLDFTRYGQQAKTLDYRGNLAKIDQKSVPSRVRVSGGVWFVGGCKDSRDEDE